MRGQNVSNHFSGRKSNFRASVTGAPPFTKFLLTIIPLQNHRPVPKSRGTRSRAVVPVLNRKCLHTDCPGSDGSCVPSLLQVQRAEYSSAQAQSRVGTGKVEEKVEKRQATKTTWPSGTYQASVISLNGEMGKWLRQLKPEDVLLPSSGRMHEVSFAAEEEKEEGGRCKKVRLKTIMSGALRFH